MAFLEEEDYGVQIRDYELEHIANYSDAIRLSSELKAQAEMESYLRARFDVAAIFGAIADDRNPLIVMYMVDISLYHLFTACTPRNVPEIRGIRYDAAINWLKMVSNPLKQIDPGLPERENEDGETPGTSIWGHSPLPGGDLW